MSAYPRLVKYSGKKILNFNMVFKEQELLGSGAFGVVVKVVDVKSGKPYAMKKIKNFNEDTLKEIEVLKVLSDKFVDVVKYYDYFFYQDNLCILMEYIPGQNASKWFINNHFGIRYFMTFALWLTDIFTRLHQFGYIHQDLKPHNIMVISKGKFKLIDFDLSCHVGYPRNALQCDDRPGGTPTFIAPEIYDGAYRNNLAFFYKTNDMYALGTSLYYILTREAPYKMFDGKIINKRYIPFYINTISKKYNDMLNEIIYGMVCIDPYKRLTAKDANKALRQFQEITGY